MKTEIIENKIEHKVITTCDICGRDDQDYTYVRIKPCQICERDVCISCSVLTDSLYDSNLLSSDFLSDHPDYVCISCWNTGVGIRHEIMKIRDIAEREEEELIESWKNMCKIGI